MRTLELESFQPVNLKGFPMLIKAHYLPATDTKQTRISVSIVGSSRRLIVNWDHEFSGPQMYRVALEKFLMREFAETDHTKLPRFIGAWYSGGMMFVRASSPHYVGNPEIA